MSEQPQRIQRKRTKGYKMPPNTISVTRPGKWGNPFKADGYRRNARMAVEDYRHWLHNNPYGQAIAAAAKVELRGKNLACFCEIGKPCHADILLKIANEAAAEIDPAASE